MKAIDVNPLAALNPGAAQAEHTLPSLSLIPTAESWSRAGGTLSEALAIDHPMLARAVLP